MTIASSLEEKIKVLVENLGFGLYEIVSLKENEHQILRVCITKSAQESQIKNSVNLEDCEQVSLALSPLLDVEIPQSQKYFLEVSSPGIERNLKTKAHFEGAVNECVKVKTFDKKEFKGKLIAIDDMQIALEGGVSITFANIKKAQTYFQW